MRDEFPHEQMSLDLDFDHTFQNLSDDIALITYSKKKDGRAIWVHKYFKKRGEHLSTLQRVEIEIKSLSPKPDPDHIKTYSDLVGVLNILHL